MPSAELALDKYFVKTHHYSRQLYYLVIAVATVVIQSERTDIQMFKLK